MRNVRPVMRREICHYFWSPIAYVVLTIFLVVLGTFFLTSTFQPGEESSMRALLGGYLPVVLLFVLPILTMHLLAEEFHSGTIETLMTAPVTESDVVVGKFLGAFLFFVVMLATTLAYAVILAVFGTLDLGLLLCTYLGLLLLGALYIAVGVFFSSCTRNQIVAVICSLAVLGIFTYLSHVLAEKASGVLRLILHHLSIIDHYQEFARGLVDTNHVIFFLTTTGLFLFVSVKTLESRRWR